MIVERLDHVNIITADLDGTVRFYEELPDLEDRGGPPGTSRDQIRWLYDARDIGVLHINSVDAFRAYDREVSPGALTGAIHHVALRCQNPEEVKARLDARGADYEMRRIDSVGLTQIFTADPNNVLLELNFFDA